MISFAILITNMVLVKNTRDFLYLVLFVFLVLFIYLFTLFENLFLPFDLTYGSDSFYYWTNISSARNFIDCSDSLAPFHVCLNSFNMFFTGAGTHIQVVLLSILTYVLMIFLLKNNFSCLRGRNFFLVFLFVFLSNFIVLLTIIRGMKEVYVLLSYVLAYVSLVHFIDKKYFTSLIFIFIAVFISANLKPYGYIFILAPFILFFYFYRFNWIKSFLMIIFLVISMNYFLDVFNIFFETAEAHAKLNGASGSLEFSSFFRFLFGPGPYFSLEQLLYSDRFVAFTKTGDFLIFVGSVQWYLVLLLYFFVVIFNFKKFINHLKTPLIFFYFAAIFYVLAYVISYDGTGDTRHRAVMYFLFSVPFAIFLFSHFKLGLKKNTRNIS